MSLGSSARTSESALYRLLQSLCCSSNQVMSALTVFRAFLEKRSLRLTVCPSVPKHFQRYIFEYIRNVFASTQTVDTDFRNMVVFFSEKLSV